MMAADWIVANRFYAPREESVAGAGPAHEFAEAAKEAAAAAGVNTGSSTAWSRPLSGREAAEPPPLPNAVEQETGA